MAGQQPPVRSWFRLASLARMEAAEAAAAAATATAGTAATLPRPTTPPFSRIPIIRPQQQPTKQPTPPEQQPIPQPQQPPQPQEPTPLQQPTPPQQPTTPQQQPPPQQPTPLQEATPLLQQPTPTQQPALLQQLMLPTPPQQPPPQQLALPQPTLPPLLEEPSPPMQLALPQKPMLPPLLQEPTSPQQLAPPQQPTLPPLPPSPRSPTPPPQAEPQPALTVTPTMQTEIQTQLPATFEAKQPPDEPQQPPSSPRIATPPEFSKVIRTLSTPPPASIAEQHKTEPIQLLASNVDAAPETKALPLPQPHSFSVAPEEKIIPRVQPPPYPEPEPETKASPTPQPNTFSVSSEKKMSANGNGRIPNAVSYDKLQVPATDAKEDKRLRVITMTGENTGAVMEFDSAPSRRRGRHPAGTKVQEDGNGHGRIVEQEYAIKDKGREAAAKTKHLTAVANSNVQGINNSIVFNSSCTQHTPGIHITFATSRHPKAAASSSSHKIHRLHHH